MPIAPGGHPARSARGRARLSFVLASCPHRTTAGADTHDEFGQVQTAKVGSQGCIGKYMLDQSLTALDPLRNS